MSNAEIEETCSRPSPATDPKVTVSDQFQPSSQSHQARFRNNVLNNNERNDQPGTSKSGGHAPFRRHPHQQMNDPEMMQAE
jgi:hypothetical protein